MWRRAHVVVVLAVLAPTLLLPLADAACVVPPAGQMAFCKDIVGYAVSDTLLPWDQVDLSAEQSALHALSRYIPLISELDENVFYDDPAEQQCGCLEALRAEQCALFFPPCNTADDTLNTVGQLPCDSMCTTKLDACPVRVVADQRCYSDVFIPPASGNCTAIDPEECGASASSVSVVMIVSAVLAACAAILSV